MNLNLRALLILIGLFTGCLLSGYSQGIKGTVKSNDGKPLPYASVYINQTKTGTTANEEGKFELKLNPGRYQIRVQNIGYQAQEAEVEIKTGWIEKNFILKEQGYMLQEVRVGTGKKEDFAYSIMRKVIARRKFHLLQYKGYEMTVYLKGTGELTKAPFFLKNKLKKEGVNINEAYTTESVSEITFRQPDQVSERVIAIRTKGTNNSSVSPAKFINTSFYRDKIAGMISPVSSSAFRWYKFAYEGSFSEGDHEINKIRVTPRSAGDNLFSGTIYIIEDEWAIHSLDLKTSIMGFPVGVRQNYAEVAPHVWLPVTHRYQFSGNVLGFAGQYTYTASCRDYKVDINQELLTKADLPDEKTEEAPEEIALKNSSSDNSKTAISDDPKASRKKFMKMMDEYEKQQLRERKHPEVVSERSFVTDSAATHRDSAYWTAMRPVPLTAKEKEGYRRDDSLARIEAAKISGKDSLKVIKKKKFSPFDLIGGGSYNFSPHTSFTLDPAIMQTNFNTVEGFNINMSGKLKYAYDSLRRAIVFAPVIRYGFSGEDFYAQGRLSKTYRKADKLIRWYAEGGKFVEQYNPNEPIHPLINTFTSLFLRQNYMKLYEKTFAGAGAEFRPSAFLRIRGSFEWADRSELFNQSDYSFFYRKSREYTANEPVNIELPSASFPGNQASVFRASATFRPVVKYRVYNGRRMPVYDNSPEFLLSYEKGIKGLLGSDVNYDKIEIGVNHGLDVGAGGRLEFELRGGGFINNKSLYLMDYAHFDGNRTILSSIRPAGAYRLLDYYLYSTQEKYFSGLTHYQFRKFLLTRIPEIRYSGIRENIFFNYLKTSNSPHYYEVGYSLDNVFRIFRIEAAAAFTNHTHQDTGFRLGIATVFSFSDRSDD